MARIVLVHWHEAEAREKARRLRALGHQVSAQWEQGGTPARAVAAEAPDVVVIDLSRLPSHGRECGVYLRQRKATQTIPLVFVEGAEEKVERVRELLPDAEYAPWSRIRSALRRALNRGGDAATPVVPPENSPTGYSGTPLSKKLGLRAGHALMLLGAPPDFLETLKPIPDQVSTKRTARGSADVIVLFADELKTLERKLPAATRALVRGGGLWLAWPKQSSGVETDVTQAHVRKLGLATGLVDNKTCAIDATWSGLRFVHRRGS